MTRKRKLIAVAAAGITLGGLAVGILRVNADPELQLPKNPVVGFAAGAGSDGWLEQAACWTAFEGVVTAFEVQLVDGSAEVSAKAQEELPPGQSYARWLVKLDRVVRIGARDESANPGALAPQRTVRVYEDSNFPTLEANDGRNPFVEGQSYRFFVTSEPDFGPDFYYIRHWQDDAQPAPGGSCAPRVKVHEAGEGPDGRSSPAENPEPAPAGSERE